MKTKTLVITAFLILFLTGATAFSAELETVNDEATQENPAEFDLIIHNTGDTDDSFRITSINAPAPSARWIAHPNRMEVESGEEERFPITVSPPEDAIQSNYQFRLNIRSSETSEIKKASGTFSVSSDRDIHIRSFDVSESEINPGENVSGSITLLNTANSRVDSFNVTAEFFNSKSTKSGYELPSGATLTHEFNLEAPQDARPGEEQFSFNLMTDNYTDKVSQSVSIGTIEDIVREQTDENFFLYTESTRSVENKGNTQTDADINVTLPSYLSPLTTFDTEPDSVNDTEEGDMYVWNFSLEPNEREQISFTTRYWIPLAVLLALIAVFVLFKVIQNPLKIQKQTVENEEGVKVRIEIENSSNKEIGDVKVIDYVPDLAYVDREFEMASPILRKTKEYTELEWEIESMNPGESRVFEYLIKPSGISEGSINLPETDVLRDGEKTVKSKTVEANFQPEDYGF